MPGHPPDPHPGRRRSFGGVGLSRSLASKTSLLLTGNEGLPGEIAVAVVSGDAAVACRGAGYRVDLGIPAYVECCSAGDLYGGVPGAAELTDDEGLGVVRAIAVVPTGAAVAR